jgi:hypothetical protein
MGSPSYPSKAELEKLREIDLNATAESVAIKNSQLNLDIPAKGLVVIEVK